MVNKALSKLSICILTNILASNSVPYEIIFLLSFLLEVSIFLKHKEYDSRKCITDIRAKNIMISIQPESYQ